MGHTRPPRQPAALTHVGGDDDEGSQVGSAHVACHVAEVGLEAPEQPGRAPLAPLDVLPGGPGARGQQRAAHADDVLADRQTDGVRLAGAPACRGPANAGRGASGRGPPAFPAQRQAAVCPGGACWGSYVHPETQRGDALVTGDQPHQAHRVWELSGQPGSRGHAAGDRVTLLPPRTSGFTWGGAARQTCARPWGLRDPSPRQKPGGEASVCKASKCEQTPAGQTLGPGLEGRRGDPPRLLLCTDKEGETAPEPLHRRGRLERRDEEARWRRPPTAGLGASFLNHLPKQTLLRTKHLTRRNTGGSARGAWASERCAPGRVGGQGLRGLCALGTLRLSSPPCKPGR